MTLIKCFTDSHIDNMVRCLQLVPDKLILVGDGNAMEAPIRRYRQLLRRRDLPTVILSCNVQGKDFSELCRVLYQLTVEEENPVIDLTGGEETAVMAVGAVLSQLNPDQRRKLRIEKFDRRTDTVTDCLRGIPCPVPRRANLQIEEMIALHGGALHAGSCQPPMDITAKDLDRLWFLAAKDPKKWNRSIKTLSEFESRSDPEDRMHIFVDLRRCDIASLPEKEAQLRPFLETLQRCGVLEGCSSRDYLNYRYTSPLMRQCTEKAGNVLELKVLLEARAISEQGRPYFQDCRMGVTIDWDGIVHDPALHIQETRNEIDVVLLHGTTPLFISCKNGNIDTDELYKLNTVAQRFGGIHAGKMLIATELDRQSPASGNSFTQRAWDMDVFLVSDAAELSPSRWEESFKSAML